ncbi:MAG: 1-phosphatidylinositol phosphodiesterase, partial [Candidatus Eremiobacteraeota bacterium]|nr:1-phosphatidylinositol phosphodiesterase [Candidatus Eremiobacteraeota bacterium]
MLSALCYGLRLTAAVLVVLSSFPVEAQAHKSDGYSHDGGAKTSNAQWMTALNNGVLLSELSIPGTHDTMAVYGGDAVAAQTMSLENQLKSGIRLIDIRCWHILDT